MNQPPMSEPEPFDLGSQDITADKISELLRLFPKIRTEVGKLDFDRLKLALGEAVEVGKERYGMNWPGKADCFKTIQAPSLGTLRPCREESINFDTTENLIYDFWIFDPKARSLKFASSRSNASKPNSFSLSSWVEF